MKVDFTIGETFNKFISEIINAATKLQSELNRLSTGVVVVEEVAEVTTAVSLPEELSKKVQAELTRQAGKNVLLRLKIDESILGGMIIRLGDKVIDCSVRYQLEQMREKLAGK